MLDFESLSAPLSDDAPSGSDLGYDPVFLQLELAGAGKAEQQYGATVIAAEPPDWRAVHEHALALAARTRDLRVAIWLTRSGARLHGIGGAVAGLRLVQRLLWLRWADVHPQIDAADGNDATMRRSAVAPLAAPAAVLADVRSAALTPTRGSITVHEIELGLGLVEPTARESVPSADGLHEAVRRVLAEDAGLAQALSSGREAVEAIAQTLDSHLSGADGLDLQPLVRLMQALDQVSRRATGATDAAAATPASIDPPLASPAATGTIVSTGAIASRDDVVRTLDRLCEWIERNEPSNPAPLLLRRAQRLMSKGFIDIVRELMPDGLDQIQKLAGIDSRSN